MSVKRSLATNFAVSAVGEACVRWSKAKRSAQLEESGSESGSGFYWICFTEKRGIACDMGLGAFLP
jgi:hypothetical protein